MMTRAALRDALMALLLFVVAPRPARAAAYAPVDLHPAGFSVSSAFAANGTGAAGWGAPPGGETHALLWPGLHPSSYVDLHPADFIVTGITGADGGRQVGGGFPTDQLNVSRALLWSGTAASVVQLNPQGYAQSYAVRVSGDQQVGWATPDGASRPHAMLWRGSAASAVDLHPAGAAASFAYDTDGQRQAGWSATSITTGEHATVWSGSAASAVDLHPGPAFDASLIAAIAGNEQVGHGRFAADGLNHALLWHDTPASAVDLHPGTGFAETFATDTNGAAQVGYGLVAAVRPRFTHALLWTGSAGSVVDLHDFLPEAYGQSKAHAIDGAGNVYGEVELGGQWHAMVWQVPEPAGATLVPVALALLCLRRKR